MGLGAINKIFQSQFFISFVFAFMFAPALVAQIYNGETGEKASLDNVFESVGPGQVLIISELHGHEPHHQNQRDLLVQMSGASFPISVGMEHFDYTKQSLVDSYVSNELIEEDFLKQMQWGSLPFKHYRFQVRFPHFRGGKSLALNIPRSISGQVAQSGFESLSDKDRSLLPPRFERGGDHYYERFYEVMKDHVSESQIENYFLAQSLWDDTMAWRVAERLRQSPRDFVMIIVGDFHATYGHGLEARLRAYGVEDVLVISQVLSESQVSPHPRYGARADFVWVAP